MPKGFDDNGDKKSTKATPTPIARRYPVEPHEARDLAVRRILHRESRRPKPNPSEWQVWLDYHDFPEVLGPYQARAVDQRPGAPKPVTAEWDRWFGESWFVEQERDDRRITAS